MPFGPDKRPDLSGVPAGLQHGPEKNRYGIAWQRNSPFWRLFRIAAVLCAVAAIVLALGMAGYSFQRWGMLTEETVETAQTEPAELREQRVAQARATYQGALRDAAQASKRAEHQHEQAMKAVEAARALAKNPDSAEARAALDKAMQEMSASAETPLPVNRSDWTAKDYGRALREGRSLTQ